MTRSKPSSQWRPQDARAQWGSYLWVAEALHGIHLAPAWAQLG